MRTAIARAARPVHASRTLDVLTAAARPSVKPNALRPQVLGRSTPFNYQSARVSGLPQTLERCEVTQLRVCLAANCVSARTSDVAQPVHHAGDAAASHDTRRAQLAVGAVLGALATTCYLQRDVVRLEPLPVPPSHPSTDVDLPPSFDPLAFLNSDFLSETTVHLRGRPMSV